MPWDPKRQHKPDCRTAEEAAKACFQALAHPEPAVEAPRLYWEYEANNPCGCPPTPGREVETFMDENTALHLAGEPHFRGWCRICQNNGPDERRGA